MTDAQKETLQFYTANDYLLINGLLWGENEKTIESFIKLINDDGRGVMAEAIEQGFDVRWKCSKAEGDKIYQIYQKRFPVIDHPNVKDQILMRAKEDIHNMMSCLEPLTTPLTLYRNIKTKFVGNLEQGMTLHYLGFSSCSLNSHFAENAVYGSGDCTLAEIIAPTGTPAIRLDLLPDVQNEPDEVILGPITFSVTKIDKQSDKIYLTANVAVSET